MCTELAAAKADRDKLEKLLEGQRFELQQTKLEVRRRCTGTATLMAPLLSIMTNHKRLQASGSITESSTQSELSLEATTTWERELLEKEKAVNTLQTRVEKLLSEADAREYAQQQQIQQLEHQVWALAADERYGFC